MTLPATADRLEDLPEAVREHYVATEDGRFRLDAEGVEDVAGLKSALEKERAARKALKAELADRGDAEEPDDDGAAPAEPGAAEPVDADAEAVPAAEIMPEPDPRRAALEARLVDAEARAALQAARGVPELLLPVLRDRLAVTDDGTGGPAVRVLDEAGAPRRRDGEDGGFRTVAELVEELRADPVYGRAFEGSGKGGSGAPTAGRGEGGPLTVSADDPRAIARHVADIAAGRVRVA
ncbi:MAG: hypothetical protein RLO51_26160 [Thalassobaculum sp.]|uniref:hypothetical protein n=1 Tax=Thalassobaculum sp. TaxID=2022740 RepID=UPI0032EF7DE9